MPKKPLLRFRHNAAVMVAALTGLVAAIPLAGARWYLTPILLIPLLVLVWSVRSGVDVDAKAVTVRALLISRPLPWSEVTGFAVSGQRVSVLVRSGRAVPLPAVSPGDVPAILKAGKKELEVIRSGEPAQAEPGPEAGAHPDSDAQPDAPPERPGQ